MKRSINLCNCRKFKPTPLLNTAQHTGVTRGGRPTATTERVALEARASKYPPPCQGLQAVREGVRQGPRGAAAHHRDARER